EVEWISLAGIGLDPLPGAYVVEGAARQLPVPGERLDRVVHVALDDVRHALVDEPFDQQAHVEDVARRARRDVRRTHPERGHLLVVGTRVLLGDLPGRAAFLGGARDDLVVDVGDVADVGDPVTEELQRAADHVERHGGARVAEMRMFVNRYPAFRASVAARSRNTRLSASFQRGSDDGNSAPMSPSPAAPRTASTTACASTSPSEWPASPSGCSIETVPSINARPGANRCASNPIPTRTLNGRCLAAPSR